MEPSVIIVIRCQHPDCAERPAQWAIIDRHWLKKSLETDDATLVAPDCQHVWHLSKQDIANGRKAFSDGLL